MSSTRRRPAALPVAGTDALLETIQPFGESPLTADTNGEWADFGPFDISAAAGEDVYLEFNYTGNGTDYLGLYVDDVVLKKSAPILLLE